MIEKKRKIIGKTFIKDNKVKYTVLNNNELEIVKTALVALNEIFIN